MQTRKYPYPRSPLGSSGIFPISPIPFLCLLLWALPAYSASPPPATPASPEQLRTQLGAYEKSSNFVAAGNTSMNLGELELKGGNPDAALQWFRKANSYYEKSKSAMGQGNALYRMGEISARKGDHPRAIEAYTSALSLYKSAGNQASVANLRNSLANLHGVMGDASFKKGDYRKALEQYRKGVGFLESDGEPLARGGLERNIGDALLKLNDRKGALDAYSVALAAYRKSGNKGAIAAMNHRLGDLSLASGKSGEALRYHEAAALAYEGVGDKARAGALYATVAAEARNLGDKSKARGYLERALPLLEKGSSTSGMIEAYISLAEIASESGSPDEGFAYLQKGLSKIGATTETRSRNRLYLALANLHAAKGENRKALDLLEKIAASPPSSDRAEYATALRKKGEILLLLGDNRQAGDCFRQLADLYRESGDEKGLGLALAGLGDAFYFSGETGKGKDEYQSALKLLTKQSDQRGLGVVNRRLGDLSMQEGAYGAAEGYYTKAYNNFAAAGDQGGMGGVYGSLADLYARMGDSGRAMEFQAKSASMLKTSGDPLSAGHALRSKGDINLRSGNNQAAMEMYQAALPLYRKVGDISGEGNIVRSIGNVSFQSGRYDEALKHYTEAMQLLRKAGDLPGEGNVLQTMGDIDYLKGNYPSALNRYSQALTLFEKCGDRFGQANIKKSQADVHVMLSEIGKAKRLYQQALDFYLKAGDIESRAYVSLGMGKAAAVEGGIKKALGYYQEGLDLLERVRKQSAVAQMKKGFLEKVYDFYEEAILFMFNNDFNEAALHAAESVKARVFLDQIAEAQVDLEQGIGQGLREKKSRLESRIAELRGRLAEAMQGGGDNTLAQSLAAAENELTALQVDIRLNNPMYAAVQYPEPATLKQLKQVLASDEILLEYFISSERVYCFVVSKSGITTSALPLTKKQLERYADDLLRYIRIGPGISSYKFEDASALLYDGLVRPLEKLLSKKSLVVVPDGALAKIPFEVLLRRGKNGASYFIESNPLKYSQSATMLVLQRTTLRRGGYGGGFVGFGDPVYDYAAFSEKRGESLDFSLSVGGEKHLLPRLEASGREISVIGDIFKSRNLPATTLLRTEAREEQAKSDGMKKYGYIHFATHGIVEPRLQAIALSRIPGAREDGLLTIAEIMKCRYTAARLVVLSACSSGLGEFNRGEGLTGLTRAVMYAGAPAAVVSLWSVSDVATKALMEKFYDRIVGRNISLEDGLRAAKLEMLEEGSLRHPLFWGAFVMYGE